MLASFMSASYKLELSGKRESQGRKYPYQAHLKASLWGIFLVMVVGGRAQPTVGSAVPG